ncbi:MAG: hypothetical protein WBD55_08125, partial [Dehalococcoidia bacterium]
SAQISTRGPERLTAVVLAAAFVFAHGAPHQFEIGHVVVAFAWALTALPTYALARGVGLQRSAALIAAALAVLGPWAVFGITFLNTTLGYLTLTALLYAMWRTLVKPHFLADLAVLVLFVLVIAARVGHAPFVLALAPAVLVMQWRDRPAGERFGRWLAKVPERAWSDHMLLVVAAAAGVLLLAYKGERGLLGDYGSTIISQHISLSVFWDKLRLITARVAQGVAVVPLLFAIPWFAHELVRPRRRETGALAVLVTGFLVIFFFVFLNPNVEDRYMVILVPPIMIAFARALLRNEVSWVAVALTGVLIARAISTVGIYKTDEPFAYFVAPSSEFFKHAVLDKVKAVLPAGDSHVSTVVLCVVVLIAVVLALRTRLPRRLPALLPGAALGVLLLYFGVGAAYTMHKFTHETRSSSFTFEQQAFVDRSVGKTTAGMLALPIDSSYNLPARWLDMSYFNQSISSSAGRLGEGVNLCCPDAPRVPALFEIDRRSGTITLVAGAMPRYLVVPTGWLPYGLNGSPVKTGFDEMQLVRVPRTLRASFIDRSGEAVFPDGWGKPGAEQRIDVFPAAAGQRPACLTASYTLPKDGTSVRVKLASGAGQITRSVPARRTIAVKLPLADVRRDRVTLVARVTGHGPKSHLNGGRLGNVRVVPCTTRA